MRVFACDPGEQTGYATGEIEDGVLTLRSWGYAHWKDVAVRLHQRQMSDDPYDVIVYEAWRLRAANAKQLTGSDLQPVQAIGALKLSAWLSGAQIISQEPAIKPIVDKQMGGKAYLPGRDGAEHHRDAVRHLVHAAIHKFDIRPDAVVRIDNDE